MKRRKNQKPSSLNETPFNSPESEGIAAPAQKVNTTTLPLYLRPDYIEWHRAAHTYEEHYATYKDLIPLEPPPQTQSE